MSVVLKNNRLTNANVLDVENIDIVQKGSVYSTFKVVFCFMKMFKE